MTNAEPLAQFEFVILALSLIRHSTFVLRHFTIRSHSSRRSSSGGGFVVVNENSWNRWRPWAGEHD